MFAPASRPSARLVLEDGTVFDGSAFGACGRPLTVTGEVVFCTAMTGYQEALTDPSYAGQILTLTAPMVGNYGVSVDDVESAGPQVAGFVIRELARRQANHRAVQDLDEWLADAGVLAIQGIDTRALVRRLRERGAMRGALSCDEAVTDAALLAAARQSPDMAGRNLVVEVSPRAREAWAGQPGEDDGGRGLRVLVLDCGAKQNIYRSLAGRGCTVEVLPHDVTARAILDAGADGLLVSNGPGDPSAVASTVRTLAELVGKLPIFGICLGHQLLALALGARTYKLKFGHRGANQPVRNLMTGQVEITSQNHGFCVDTDSLAESDCEITHLHLNDGTVAGFRHRRLPVMSVQYHPEASPGPHDSAYLFDCFCEMMRTRRPLDPRTVRDIQARRRTTNNSAAAGVATPV